MYKYYKQIDFKLTANHVIVKFRRVSDVEAELE